MSRSKTFLFAMLTLAWAALPEAARACATCFGASDSRLAQGMNMGILSLLAVVVFVLGGFVAFFAFLARRAATTSDPNRSEISPSTQ